MDNLQIIKSENFGSVTCDFLRNGNGDILMTSEQLGRALGYLQPRKSINNIVLRNEYLKKEEFSGVINLMSPGGIQETRVFTEDGIYEITFLAKTDKAMAFRTWVRNILKSLRKGDAELINKEKNLNALRMMNNQLGLLIESQEELVVKINDVDNKVETQITLTNTQAKDIQFAVNGRVIYLLKGKESEDYKLYKNKYFQALYRDIKKRLAVPSYRDILKKDYELALGFVKNWIPEQSIRM
ncbi:ORF6C domain-containing protein [Tepidibacter mesophilus]|uniref:ORF6C domain-containing protein n=1 Tax=Tepidibacter mesophilus TaxID=655607 RepID=UPI001650E3F2|nr:ORF6C domain-containing protein [Tepidibacter mesophilus]